MENYTRQLIHVPIIHSPADMGVLAEGLEAAFRAQFGPRRWQEYADSAEAFWTAVEHGLEKLALDFCLVDLYQDGLPVCGREGEIVRQAAERGSRNHQLLLDLAARGARLVGTEAPALLLAEYHNVGAALAVAAGTPPAATATNQAGAAALLARRDAFIARRIGRTLAPGRTGVLFLGMAHHVEPHLPNDIIVSELRPGA